MAHFETQEVPLRAPQVCSHCKFIKKGCDKKLPRCGQCIKRRAVCRYGERTEPRKLGEVGTERNGDGSWSLIPRGVLGTLSPISLSTNILMNSLSDVFSSNATAPEKKGDASSEVHWQVHHIIRTDGDYVHDITQRYFGGVHRWLPIMSRKQFNKRLAEAQNISSAGLSILLLAMRLITKHPSKVWQTDQDQEVLYLATKTLFAQVHSYHPPSISIIQAGILLAMYEHGHGKIEAAYVTIGTTARIAFAAGLHNKQRSDESRASNEWTKEEEELSTWWGLVICDRAIGCDPTMTGRPLATRYIRDDDFLPLEIDDLDENADLNPELSLLNYVSETTLPDIGTFGRHAQAAFLLDRVLLATDVEVIDDTRWSEMYALHTSLQTLLSTIMGQVGGRWGVYCGATALTVTGLYILHQKILFQPEAALHPEYLDVATVTLNTITRMVIDISSAFNLESKNLDLDILSPSIAHIARCAQQHIIMAGDFQNEQWSRDFEELRTMLKFFNKRWQLAGKELHNLDESFDITTRLLI